MTEFKVDLEAMAALVESLNSFEEKMKEYDVEDWVPNSGMLENLTWDPTNAFHTWEALRSTGNIRVAGKRCRWGTWRVRRIPGEVERAHEYR